MYEVRLRRWAFNTKEEIEETYNIASVRIHAERCIARIEMYSNLNKITNDLLPYYWLCVSKLTKTFF